VSEKGFAEGACLPPLHEVVRRASSTSPAEAAMNLSDDLRRALRQVASSVAIVAAHGTSNPIGMTATALSVVSLTPPALLVCVNRTCQLHTAILERRAFRISYLSQAQSEVASVFGGGRAQEERFAVGSWDLDAAHGPALRGSLASFGCSLSSQLDHGTHTIFVGTVEDVRFGSERPLLYRDGAYCRVV
jgi:flavin reductase